MKILAIETSTYAGSIAVLENERILGEYYFDIGPAHTEKLVPSIVLTPIPLNPLA